MTKITIPDAPTPAQIRAAALEEAAKVVENHTNNGPHDNQTFRMQMPDLPITGRFEWEYMPDGADAVHVTPPEGIMCLPVDCILVAPEGGTETLLLFSTDGIGA